MTRDYFKDKQLLIQEDHLKGIKIEKIGLNQMDDFLAILKEIAVWLKDKGNEMWSIDALEKLRFIEENKNSECYIVSIDGESVAVFMLLEENRFWWPDVDKGDSIFLKKLGVRRHFAGMGISTLIIKWVIEQARQRNKNFVRIEFYSEINNLRTLYSKNGFRFVKQLTMPDETKIALYEYEIV
jgi:GNAT superfamily N-acetyltransferase